MSFKRRILPKVFKTGDALTADLIGMGMLFSGKATKNPNIEDTLISASIEGFSHGDQRVISLMVDWIEIHGSRINVDRLTRMVQLLDPHRFWKERIFWTAIAQRNSSDPRFKRMAQVYSGPRINYFKLLEQENDPTDFFIQKNGEDSRFEDTCLRVPLQVIRHRTTDILSPKKLSRIHSPYYFRVLMGPSYRADLWAFLQENPDSTPAEMARECYASHKTARQVKRDALLLKNKKVA